jgi:putative phosphonate catabolism associated alcohol dehydrogenase
MPTATAQIFDGPGQPLRRETLPLPQSLRPGEVLVAIDLATICGSDLHTLSGLRQESTPLILGHEAIGRVVAAQRPNLEPGDRISWSIADSCGTCPPCTDHYLPEKCHALFKYGHAALTDGSGLNGCYATHLLLRPGTHIAKVDERLSDAVVAPANCALATAVNAAALLPIPCHRVLVQGAGLLGLYTCALLASRGIEDVYCTDIDAGRLARVADFGAIPADDQLPEDIDAVFEVAGNAALVPQGIAALRPGGFYIFVGMVHPDTQLQLTGEQVIRKCLTIRGVHNYSPRHLDEALEFLALTAESYPYDSLVSDPFPLLALDQAISLAETRQHFRVAIRPNP